MEEEGACAHKSEVTRAIDATKTLQQKKERDAKGCIHLLRKFLRILV